MEASLKTAHSRVGRNGRVSVSCYSNVLRAPRPVRDSPGSLSHRGTTMEGRRPYAPGLLLLLGCAGMTLPGAPALGSETTGAAAPRPNGLASATPEAIGAVCRAQCGVW